VDHVGNTTKTSPEQVGLTVGCCVGVIAIADGVIVRSVMEVYSAPPPAAGKMFFSTLQLNIAGLELSFEGNPAVRRYVTLSVTLLAISSAVSCTLRVNIM